MKRDLRPIRIATSLVVAIFLLTGCTTSGSTAETTIPVSVNQKLVSGRIVSILGNEVTLVVLQDTTQTAASESGTAANDAPVNGSIRTRPSGGTRTRPSGDTGEFASPTGESMAFMIPVGTKVMTTLGKTTTFSRLVAGDSIKVLFETADDGTSVVVGIWMSEN